MASFRGNIIRSMIAKKYNVNIKTTDDPLAAIKRMEKNLVYRTPKNKDSLHCEKRVTAAGTRYERMIPKDAVPSDLPRQLILYLHGGAYVWGLSDFYRTLAPDFSQAAGHADVIFLDYDTAPKYQYPHQHKQALDLWNEITCVLDYDPKQIIVGGDSAGANLMLSFLLQLRDQGKELPRAAFSISLWGDMTASGESYRYNYHQDVMFGYPRGDYTEEVRLEMIHSPLFSFVGENDPGDPYISPVFGDYKDFPPMLFTAGADEMPLSDTLSIMKNFEFNGIPVQLFSASQMFHIYPLFRNFFYEAETDYHRILHFIRQKFHEPVFRSFKRTDS